MLFICDYNPDMRADLSGITDLESMMFAGPCYIERKNPPSETSTTIGNS
jgi:hypothetical protein